MTKTEVMNKRREIEFYLEGLCRTINRDVVKVSVHWTYNYYEQFPFTHDKVEILYINDSVRIIDCECNSLKATYKDVISKV